MNHDKSACVRYFARFVNHHKSLTWLHRYITYYFNLFYVVSLVGKWDHFAFCMLNRLTLEGSSADLPSLCRSRLEILQPQSPCSDRFRQHRRTKYEMKVLSDQNWLSPNSKKLPLSESEEKIWKKWWLWYAMLLDSQCKTAHWEYQVLMVSYSGSSGSSGSSNKHISKMFAGKLVGISGLDLSPPREHSLVIRWQIPDRQQSHAINPLMYRHCPLNPLSS